jgi:hypothetical protein
VRKNFGVNVCYILLGLIIVSSFVLKFSQKGFAATTEIQSTIEPVRYVYINNSNGKIEKILSNSSLVPTNNIHWLDNNSNSVKPSRIIKLQYDGIIKNINLNHFGQIYSAPTNTNNIFSKINKLKKIAEYFSVLPNIP